MNVWALPYILAALAGAIYTGVSLYRFIEARRGVREAKQIKKQMEETIKEMDKIISQGNQEKKTGG